MKGKTILALALVLTSIWSSSIAQDARDHQTEADKVLTEEISKFLRECGKIKPGMTRAQLLEVFTTEGGISTARQQRFVYRHCPYLKVAVEFKLSELDQSVG